MKIFIRMFMVLTLVMATSFPSTSHAMASHDVAKVEKTRVSSEHGDCHKHAKTEQSSKAALNDKESGKCCNKGVCKCAGGHCHNALSHIFSNGSGLLFLLTSGKGSFAFTNDMVESAPLNRLKRPPKA